MPEIFVGRHSEQDAFRDWVLQKHSAPGAADLKRAALVVGTRGVGKSALLRRFEELCFHHSPATWYVQHLTVNANETPSAFLDRVLREIYGLFRWKYVPRGPNDKRLMTKLLAASTTLIAGGAPVGQLIEALVSPDDARPGHERFLDYLTAISSVLTADERLVILIDPVRVMHRDQAEEWFSIARAIPSKIRVVVAQRPDDPIVTEPEWSRFFSTLTGDSNLTDLSFEDVTELYGAARAREPLLLVARGWTSATCAALPRVAFDRFRGHPFAHAAVVMLLSQLAPDEDPLGMIESVPPKLSVELVEPLYKALRRQSQPRRTLLLLLQLFRIPVPKPTWAASAQMTVAELDAHIAAPEFAQYVEETCHPVLGPMYLVFHSIFADRLERVLAEETAFANELAERALKMLPASQGGTTIDGDSYVTDFDLIAASHVASRLSDARAFIAIVKAVSARKEEIGMLDWAIMDHTLVLDRNISAEANCDAHATIGALHYKRGRLTLAHKHYEADLALARDEGDRDRVASALGNVASIAHARRSYGDAVRYLGEALQLHRELQDSEGIARNLGNLGRVYFALEDFDRAESAAREAMALFEEKKDSAGMLSAHLHLSNALSAKGDHTLARSHLLKAKGLAKTRNDTFIASSCYGNLGTVELRRGHAYRALVLFTASLDLARRYDYPEMGGMALLNLGRLAKAASDHAAARSYLNAAKLAFEQAERPDRAELVDNELKVLDQTVGSVRSTE